MRILICSISYAPRVTGQAIFVEGLAEGLAAKKHEVMVLVPHERGFPERELRNGVLIVRIPALNLNIIHPELRLPLVSPIFIHQIFEIFEPEIVHLQDPSPISLSVQKEAHQRKIPVVLTHHPGPEISSPFVRTSNQNFKKLADFISWKVFTTYLNQGDIVTVPSRFSAELLVKHGVTTTIETIPCGIPLARFQPTKHLNREAIFQQYGMKPNVPVLLYVGRIDIEKNLEVIVRSIALVKDHNFQFVIAGQGPFETELRQLVSQLEVENKVLFIGQVNHSDLPDLLKSADVFVMPGNAESFSIATLEAMICGKPILAANSAALPELVENEINGYLFSPLDADDIARTIVYCIEHPEKWAGLGEKSKLKASHYGLDNLIGNYEKVFEMDWLPADQPTLTGSADPRLSN